MDQDLSIGIQCRCQFFEKCRPVAFWNVLQHIGQHDHIELSRQWIGHHIHHLHLQISASLQFFLGRSHAGRADIHGKDPASLHLSGQ